ncbi:MAG: cobalt-zinc-cadmium efflux system protein [Chloroflexota bacterium]|nr:cobalt-zinc-cadmium efflux system protein [Chloroflexota bacterium]
MAHNHHHEIQKNIKLAFFLNAGFAIAELFGGLFTNSMAIMADALHDLGDSITLAVSWRLEILAERSGDVKFSYGYKRFSLLSALISGVVLVSGSIYVIIEAVQRLMAPQESNARGMLIFALIGIAINGYAAFRTSRGKNMNSRMISWHMIEDVLGWAAVLIVSLVLMVWDIEILDPLLSLGLTAFVLFNVGRNLWTTMRLFLQGVPDTVNIHDIEAQISSLDKVRGVHHTHVWSLDGEQHVLTTHVVLCLDAKKEDIRRVKEKIRDMTDQYELAHTTVEFEYLDEDCSMNHTKHTNCPENEGEAVHEHG